MARVSSPARFGGSGSMRVLCVIPVRRDRSSKCDGLFSDRREAGMPTQLTTPSGAGGYGEGEEQLWPLRMIKSRKMRGWSTSMIRRWAAARATPVRTRPSRAAGTVLPEPWTRTRIRVGHLRRHRGVASAGHGERSPAVRGTPRERRHQRASHHRRDGAHGKFGFQVGQPLESFRRCHTSPRLRSNPLRTCQKPTATTTASGRLMWGGPVAASPRPDTRASTWVGTIRRPRGTGASEFLIHVPAAYVVLTCAV